MPWWAIIYLVVFVGVSVVSSAIGTSDGTTRLRWFAELLTDAVFGVLFAGYWLPSLLHSLGLAAPVLFVASVAWELYSAPGDLREIWSDAELSQSQRIALIIAAPLLMWPLFIIAGVGVFSSHGKT